MKPFIKWVGGKRRSLPELQTRLPGTFNRIVEPFVGGGAFFLSQEETPAVINDFNWQLSDTYRQVKSDPEALISALDKLPVNKEFYLELREKAPTETLEVATRFIYLNKVGFNGLWRENSKGKFNVPYGKKDGKLISDLVSYDQIREASNRLQNTTILNGDFSNTLEYAEEGDLFFIDPPYVDTWDDYIAGGFSAKDHKRLVEGLLYLDAVGAKFMLTNSYNDVTVELYKDFKQAKMGVSYVVGGKNASRDKRAEIIVTNY